MSTTAAETIVDRLYRGLYVDDRWSQRDNDGFTWWPYRLAQRIWAEPAVDDDGFHVSRVCAETRLLKGLPPGAATENKVAVINAWATLSAYVLHEDGTLRMHCSAFVHDETVDLIEPLMRAAVAMQAADAQIMAAGAGPFAARADESPHPKNGWRDTPDDMLNVLEVFAFEGQTSPSNFTDEYESTASTLVDGGLLATPDEDGLTVELPCLGIVPAVAGGRGTSMLQVNEVKHPKLGSGALMGLYLPASFNTQASEMANEFNRVECRPDAFSRAHFLGGWCARDDDVVFVTFLPALAYRPGLLLSLVASMANRARFFGELLAPAVEERSA